MPSTFINGLILSWDSCLILKSFSVKKPSISTRYNEIPINCEFLTQDNNFKLKLLFVNNEKISDLLTEFETSIERIVLSDPEGSAYLIADKTNCN